MKKHQNYGWLYFLAFLVLLCTGILLGWPMISDELEDHGICFSEWLPWTRPASSESYVSRTPEAEEDHTNELPSENQAEQESVKELPEVPEEIDSFRSLNYYYQQLDETGQLLYRQILDAVLNRKESVRLFVEDDEQIDLVYHGLLKDHPEIFWIHNRKEIYKTTYPYRKECVFTPSYLYSESESEAIRQSMEEAYQTVSGMVPETADSYEILKTVYTYVIDETEYMESEDDQSIAGVFWKKQAVCAGYAGAVQYLLGRLGIPCIYVDGNVEGKSEGHAWNMVQLDGDWYYVDTTNGDQPEFLTGDFASLSEHKTTLMDYCCPFPDEYEKNYHSSKEYPLPACTAIEKNFYVKNQGIFYEYDWQNLYDYCCMRINNDAAVVRFKYADQISFEKAVEEWINQESIREIARYYMQRNGLNEIEYHYGVLEDLKTVYFIF